MSFQTNPQLELAFDYVNLDWEKYVQISDQFTRPLEVESLCGDASRAKEIIGWNPQVFAPQLAQIMIDADINRTSFLY